MSDYSVAPPPFRPSTMSTAEQAAVSYLARYVGHTHSLYSNQLKRSVLEPTEAMVRLV